MTALGVPLFWVDAFTDRPFAGNPAAVCLLDRWASDDQLSGLASELNLSETAYLVPEDGGYRLRWFTPAVEVDLCGHATLASAFVVWHVGKVAPDQPIKFLTRSGALSAARRGEVIELDFPLKAPVKTRPPAGLVEALGIAPAYVGRSQLDYLVEVESESDLRGMAPDFRRLTHVDCRGVIVTARSAREEFDFVSRFFAPASGVDEDPVTGSAHCTLAPFWGDRLRKNEMRAYQASKRGGIVNVRLQGDRVLLGGTAVLVAKGELVAAWN
jgi:PhzF family phenazine biosynthesis protein